MRRGFYKKGKTTDLDLKGKGWEGNPKSNIVYISDTQFPYHHQDALEFCAAVARVFQCGSIVSVGDLVDFYWFGDYTKSIEAQSFPQDELATIAAFDLWGEVFPKMDVIIGNHENRYNRRLAAAGIPERWLPLQEVLQDKLGMHKGWKLHGALRYEDNCCGTIVIHGDEKGANVTAGSTTNAMGRSVVRGHHHSASFVHTTHTMAGDLRYDMQLGCLIDDEAVAYNYNKKDLKRPVLNAGVCLGGYKFLIPMIVDENNRWTGEIL